MQNDTGLDSRLKRREREWDSWQNFNRITWLNNSVVLMWFSDLGRLYCNYMEKCFCMGKIHCST